MSAQSIEETVTNFKKTVFVPDFPRTNMTVRDNGFPNLSLSTNQTDLSLTDNFPPVEHLRTGNKIGADYPHGFEP